jgi:hypothetical protein
MRCLIVLAVLAVLAGPARAELVHYLGPHPISPKVMKGMCHIEGPHIHDYVPHKPVLYVQAGDSHAFVGDPTEFEGESPRYSYYGHHPVFWANVEVGGPAQHICYITGPHHHWYAPPTDVQFVARGGAYWYIGPMPPGYVRRWHRHSPIDDYYGHVTLLVPAPVVTIEPPEGFVGFYFGPGYRGRHHHHRGGYYGPRVGVSIGVPPPPSVVIGGGVYVGGGGGHGKVHGHHPPAWGRGGAPPGHGGGHGGGHGRGRGGKGH